MSDTNTPIRVEGLTKSYGPRRVLDGVDLQADRGEVVALLGPNGAGKTTTVEILEGYRRPDDGVVRVLGLDPGAHPVELRRRVGVVLQECGFPAHARVDELIDLWRGYYPAPRPTGELLELVELTGDRDTLVRRLSGGQRRRLDFALALAGNPDVVFLDEPTTGFDPEARRRCWAAIENLSTLGKTILLTTHYLDEAERLADRIAILAGGRITAAGTSEQLSRLAGSPTTIAFRAAAGTLEPHRRLLERLDAAVADDRVVVRTLECSTALRALLTEVGPLPDLIVAPPTLEDSYLLLVGREEEVAR